MRHGTNRRSFLGQAALGVTAAAALRPGKALPRESASDRVRTAVIGVNGRGADLARLFASSANSEVAALCDVDARVLEKPAKQVDSISGKTPSLERDFRRLLDRKDIDAIAVATPDHWHAHLAIMACQAGKDVYVEKPASHNIIEGRRMVEAARKYDRVVQVGTQRRSAPFIHDAAEYVRTGKLGPIAMARAWIHQKRGPIGRVQASSPPAELDWDLWQGPAMRSPYRANVVHYNWHWFWNWGTGELGNNGIHAVDLARWLLGVEAPVEVSSAGGRFVFDDDGETPDTQITTWKFPGCVLQWEHRMWSDHREEGSSFGVACYGERGTLVLNDEGWTVSDSGNREGGKTSGDPQAAHVTNFLECVRSRQKPSADIEIGHLSTQLCHLGNIAYRLGMTLRFDANSAQFVDSPEANRLLGREYDPGWILPRIG
jgi:predicted dehydrogenase